METKFLGKYKNVIFGCQMNVHESEKIAGILESLGYTSTDNIEEADIIAFNTCCIRDTAEKRALGNIGAVKPLKKKNKNLIVIVAGCMTQQSGMAELINKKYPYVDIVIGTHNISELGEKIVEFKNQHQHISDILDSDGYISDETTPVTRTSFPNAWVNINYGCNNFCTYCIVPYVRGRERSRDMTSILSEIKSLLANGYKEITLLGQNVNSYGNDINNDNVTFPKLLEEIAKLDGKFRLRFMTSHPKDLSQEVVDIVAKYDNICKNIHLPIQSGSNAVLSRMNRRYTREHYLDLIKMIREKIPDCGITTDIMVGFPDESENDFEDTIDLVKKVQFENAFTFIYSVRKGTKAAEMPQLDYDTKRRRIGELIKIQNQITSELGSRYIGLTLEVLIENTNAKKPNMVCGRTDTGRLVNAIGSVELIGTFQQIKITEAHSASLVGEII